ncbi:MAG: copper-translocating P-type ATPase [Gemmatimonadota bacterium]
MQSEGHHPHPEQGQDADHAGDGDHGHRADHGREDHTAGDRGHGEHGKGGAGNHGSHHAHMVEDFKRRFWVSLVLTIPILLLAPLIQEALGLVDALAAVPFQRPAAFLLSSAVFFYGGWPFLTGLFDELSEVRPGMMTLIALAIGVAYFYSTAVVFGLEGEPFFWELATLIDIMLLGHWIEMRSVMGASRALEELVELMPAEAHLLQDDGSTREVPVTELNPGDRILVKPGEKIPADGTVVKGTTSVNEAMLTGESRPVSKGEGDEVIGGAVNGEAAVTVEVGRTGEESYLAQMIDLVEEAQGSRSKTQDLADRAALWLTLIALTAGAVTLVAWLGFAGRDLPFSIERMVTVMVITCPHALGLAIPLVVAVSTGLSARNGLLVRDRSAFERARNLDAVILDKTGTLTEGRFGVSDAFSLGERSEDEILRLAASLESQSEHPIAAGVVRGAEEREISFPPPDDFSAIPGKGAQGRVEGVEMKVVSPGYLEEHGLSVDHDGVDRASEEGNTVVFLLVEDRVEGAIALADVIREESRNALRRLKEMGIQVMMLTGDSEDVARSVARELDLDDFFAGVLPDQKQEKVREVKARGLRVAMVGDGVNDAPALVEADVGIAIGAGTDVAVKSADIVLVRSDPRDVAAIVELSGATYRKMVQNLWWATGYNVFAIPLAAGVLFWAGILLSPAMGAVLMSLSTVVVAVNARLLGRWSRSRSS